MANLLCIGMVFFGLGLFLFGVFLGIFLGVVVFLE